jgi:hypothetical protein
MVRRFVVIAVALALFAALVPSARAQDPGTGTVSLESDADLVRWGDAVRLSGEVSTGEEGAEIRILDQDDAVVAEAVTAAGGVYEASFVPRRNVILRAEWLTVQSPTVQVRVKPIVKVNLYHVELFGRALVTGNVQPGLPGQRVALKLRRNGRVVAKKTVAADDGRYFKARFRIRKPGSYTVRASADPTGLASAGKTSRKRRTSSLPSLGIGSSGAYVKRLEWRLRDLGYYLPRADSSFDEKTRDALLAFTKVQRSSRVGNVTAATWRRLASPVKAKPRVKSKFHIEIDQSRQVIFVVKNRKVKWILHTSTGKASTPTRDGVWKVYAKIAGYSPKRLYYPSFFDGGRAIHGWPDVPTYPASHGCSRVPMWAAQWIYGIAETGTTVRVYH